MSLEGLIRAQLEIWPPEPTPRPGRPGRGVPRRRRRVPWRLPGFDPSPAKRRAAVAEIGSSATANAETNPSIGSYTLAAGDDRIVVVAVVRSGTSPTINSVTIDGSAATIQENVVSGSWTRTAIAYRVMGSSGSSGSIAVSASTDSGTFGSCTIRVIAFENVDQSSPISDSDNNTGSGQTSSQITLASASGELCVDCLGTGDDTIVWAEDTGQTEIGTPYQATLNFLTHTLHTSKESGATSVTMGWTGSSATIAHVGMALNEAGAAAVPTITSLYGSKGSTQTGQLVPGADDLTSNGANYEASQGTGGLYLADGTTFATATKLAQKIKTWSATSITTYGTYVGTLLGSAQSGTLYAFVQNDTGDVSSAYPVYVAHRDVRIVCGSFTTPASTGNLDVTHPRLPDSKVKAIFLWTTGQSTTDSSQASLYTCCGMADGTLQAAIETYNEDNIAQSSANSNRQQWTDRCLVTKTISTATITNSATYSGSIAGGFRLNFGTANASGITVHYIAIAGEDADVEMGSATVSSGAVTGLGLRPEFVICMTACNALADSPAAFVTQSVGVFNDELEEAQWSIYGGTTWASQCCMSTNDYFVAQVDGGSVTWGASIASITDTGFTWTGSNADGFRFLACNFKGLRTKIQTMTKTTSSAPVSQSLPDFGFVPQVVGLFGVQRTTEASSVTNVAAHMGAYDYWNNCGDWIGSENNVDPFDTYRRIHDDACVVCVDPTNGTLLAEAYAEPVDNDTTPNIRWTTNNAVANLIQVWGVEHPEAGADKPRGIRPNVFSW